MNDNEKQIEEQIIREDVKARIKQLVESIIITTYREVGYIDQGSIWRAKEARQSIRDSARKIANAKGIQLDKCYHQD